MIIAFWVAVGGWSTWLLGCALVMAGFDSWGEHFVPLAWIGRSVGLVGTVGFVALFALHALDISVSVGRSR